MKNASPPCGSNPERRMVRQRGCKFREIAKWTLAKIDPALRNRRVEMGRLFNLVRK